MNNTLIYVGWHAIRRERLDDAKAASKELVEYIETNHPTMAHFEIDIDDDASEMTVLQIHPNEESLLRHLDLAAERIQAAYDFLEQTTRIEIFGSPSEELVDAINQMSAGAPVSFNTAVAGFSRVA